MEDVFGKVKGSIPRAFTLFGQKYTIDQHSEIIDKNPDVDGQITYGTNQISIRTINDRREWLSEDYKQMVFWHEVIHAILHNIQEDELNSNEKFVSLMGNSLHQVVKSMEFEQ